MSLSNIDTSKLEALTHFKAFFDMVQNPAKFAAIVADAEKTLADAKVVIEAHTTVELANEYLTKAKAFANEKTAEIEAKVQAAQEAATKRQAQIEASRVEAEKSVSIANQMFADAEKLQKQLADSTASLNAEQARLALRADELYRKEVQLQEKERELNQKGAKLKELLG